MDEGYRVRERGRKRYLGGLGTKKMIVPDLAVVPSRQISDKKNNPSVSLSVRQCGNFPMDQNIHTREGGQIARNKKNWPDDLLCCTSKTLHLYLKKHADRLSFQTTILA